MQRVENFKFFIKNLLGVIEILCSVLDKRNIDQNRIHNMDNIYKNKLLSSSDKSNIIQNTKECIILIIEDISNKIINSYQEFQIIDFKFLLCALADEIIINSSILKLDIWINYLTERSIFATAISGEKIISKINTHIKSHNSRDNEMSIVYFYAICIGYKGIYIGNNKKITEIKKALLQCINSDYGFQDIDNIDFISECAYKFIISSHKSGDFTDYFFIYKNIIIIALLSNSIFILYVWFFYIKSKIAYIA